MAARRRRYTSPTRRYLHFLGSGGGRSRSSGTPGSESAGYHYPGVPKHPAPTRTPVTSSPPSEAATSPAGHYAGAAKEYTQSQRRIVHSNPEYGGVLTNAYVHQAVSDLLSPGPTAREIAQAAHTLGVKPKEQEAAPTTILDALSNTPGQETKTIDKTVQQAVHDVRDLVKLPKDTGARPTLGTPSAQRLVQASAKGKVRVNRRGQATLPAERDVLHRLGILRKKTANAGIEGVTHGEEATRFANALAKDTGLDPRFVGAWVQAEGGGFSAGGQAGKNNWLGVGYPGEQTPFSQSAHFNGSPEQAAKATADWIKGKLTGVPGYDYKASSGIQAIIPKAAHKGPEAALQALEESGWGTNVDSVRQNLATISARPLNQQAERNLQQAKLVANHLGIPSTKAGDISLGGRPNTVLVRADAKGMVDWAKANLGTQEGTPKQLRWDAAAGIASSEPWCAAFIGAGLERRGVTPPSNSAYAGNYLNWKGGTNIGTDLSKAKPGDLIVFGNSEHIALYKGGGRVIAGNWSNEVAEYAASEDSRGIQGIVRPHYKGGQVEVAAGAPLPSGVTTSGETIAAPAASGATPGVSSGSAAGGRGSRPLVVSAGSQVSPLLAIRSILPAAFGPGSAEPEAEAEGGVIDRLLTRHGL